jgi:hypothetical protein
MNEIAREIMDLGLGEVVYKAQSMVGNCRRVLGTNDIVISAFVEDNYNAKLYGRTRERTLQILEETMSDSLQVVQRLRTDDIPVTSFLLIITFKEVFYCVDCPIPDGSEGILN